MQHIESTYLLTNRNYIADVDHYQGIEYVDTETSEDDPFSSSGDFQASSYYFTKLGEEEDKFYGKHHRLSSEAGENGQHYTYPSCNFEECFNQQTLSILSAYLTPHEVFVIIARLSKSYSKIIQQL